MPFLKAKCPQCGKDIEIVKDFQIGDHTVSLYKCGHSNAGLDTVDESNYDLTRLRSLDNKALFKYQIEGAKFGEQAKFRCLIGDEMGLGKTVQALAMIAAHPELGSFVVVTKSTLLTQWQHEVMRWLGEDAIAQVIDDSRTPLLPGCTGYIISYDLLRRIPDIGEKLLKIGVKTTILDEVQQIKNESSTRAIEVRKVVMQFKHVIALSGTPIKNRASEFFSILNILRPDYFPSKQNFLTHWTESYWDGFRYKTGGLKNEKGFRKITSNFVIRRTREEVMPDLPKITRNFSFANLSATVEKAYAATFKEFQNEYDSLDGETMSFEESGNILAYLAKMRHLTGLSKVDNVVDFVSDFLDSCDRKIVVFVHHKDVGALLAHKLNKLYSDASLNDLLFGCPPPLQLVAELSAQERAAVIEKFSWASGPRVLIASTLASGEGLNLQFCSDCVMLERQWNPANEEQAEGRFIRIGQLAQAVMATYFVATGTIDEFFAQLVEEKRAVISQTLDGVEVQWNQTSIMQELSSILASQGAKKWSLK